MLPLMPKRTICIPDEGGWRRRAGLIVQSLRGSPCEKNVREVSLHFHELDHVA